ncbi:DNA-binding response regulator, partial [Malaciobacter mytili]|uniref:helix-turn-helix domain-containing protein n=1 Tax=Malaciobacter mytili TaxID=603050 RepID=UPI00102555B3
ELFISNIDKKLSNDYIIDYVWEQEIKSSYPLRQLVSDLKKSLNTEKKIISTIHGFGYKFQI